MTPPTPAPMSWKRSAIATALVIPVVALLWYGLTTDPRTIRSPLPGKPAPAWDLERMDTRAPVSLSYDAGSVVVINFWASWCLPCRDEHPVLIEAANEYMPRGVKFYGILNRDTESAAQAFLDELGPLPYPTLVQGKTHTGIDYGLTGTPETFVIDQKGIVAYKKTGPFADRRELGVLLDSLLAAAPQAAAPQAAVLEAAR